MKQLLTVLGIMYLISQVSHGQSGSNNIAPSSLNGNNVPITITNFNNAGTGKYIVKLNFFTNTYNTKASMTATVDLDAGTITASEYSHFASQKTNDLLNGNGTATLTTQSQAYCQFKVYLSGKTLYAMQLMNPAGASFRLEPSTWEKPTYNDFTPEPNAKYQIRLASDPTKALILEAQSTYDSKGHPLKTIHLLNLATSVGNPLGFIPHEGGKYYQLHYNKNRYFGVLPDDSRNVGLFYGDVNPRKLFRFLVDSKGNVIIKSALNDDDKHVIGVADDGKSIVELAQHTVTPDRMLFTLTKYIEEPPAGAPSSNTNPRPNDGKPVTLFPETHTVPKTVPAMKFKLIDLVCIETQDDGSDEIVLNVWIDGKRMSIPTNGYQDMNEESETEQWMLDRAFSFTNSVKVEIREVDREISGFEDIDNSGNEIIGVLELDMNSAQGDQIKSFMGPDDSHYILRFQLGNVEILPIAFFSDEHINEYVLPASKQGGSLVDSAFDEQKRAFDKLDEYFGQNKDTPTSPIASPDISPEAEIVLNQTITAVTGAIAGVCVKSGPVGWAVGGALLAVGAATFLPAYFAGQNGVLELEIANLSNQKLEIESFEMSSGKKVSGSNKGGIIPAKGGPDQTPISFFSFRKKWGMTGIVGKINFKPTPHMPKGMIVEFSTPFVGTSTCKVDIPAANGNSNAGKSAWNGMMRAYIGMDARNDLFPKIIVTLQNDTSGNK